MIKYFCCKSKNPKPVREENRRLVEVEAKAPRVHQPRVEVVHAPRVEVEHHEPRVVYHQPAHVETREIRGDPVVTDHHSYVGESRRVHAGTRTYSPESNVHHKNVSHHDYGNRSHENRTHY